jgi:hypothetical protein
MFLWKDFMMGHIRKIQNTRRKGTQIRKIKKNKKERMEERKRRDFIFNVLGGSHTRVLHQLKNTLELPSL